MRRNCCVGLDVDAVGAVVEVEVVDVAGAHEGVEGRGDLTEGDAHGLGLLAIDGDEQLRIVGGEGGVHAGEAGAGRAALADDGVGDAVDVAEGVAAGVLQDELEAADGADAGDGGGFGCEGDAAGDAEELGADVGDDGVRGEVRPHLGAVVDGFERGEDEAGVWRAAAGEREAHDGEGAEDAVVLADECGDLVGEGGGVAERGAGRRLDDDEEVGLVLLRDEGRGDVVVHVRGGCQAAEEDEQHDVADANDEGDHAGVDADDPLDEPLDGVEEEAHDSRVFSVSARRRIAARAGESVSALKAEMAMEKAMVSENCL